MPWGLAIGAGVGLLKSQLVDVPKEHKQRALAAATQRYSPWTHMQAGPVAAADPFGSALSFGATGASVGSGMASAKKDGALSDAMTNYYNSKSGTGQGGYGLAPGQDMGPTYKSPWGP